MKRIEAAIKGKIENSKEERTIKRIWRAIETAKDNANDRLDELKDAKQELVEGMANNSNYECFLERLSGIFDEEEEQKASLKRLEEISAYFNEDVTVKK